MFQKLSLSLLTVFFLSSFAYGVECDCKEYSTISVNTTLNEDVTPDTAKIKFYVTNTGLKINDIKEKNDKVVNEAITAIKAKLGTNEQIKTITYSIRNIYSYKDKIRIFQKYEVKNGFEVKLKDLSKISEIIKIATNSGIEEVSNINFYIEDTEAICNSMLKSVSAMAKTRAQNVAGASGEILGKAKQISPSCSLDRTTRVYSTKTYAAMNAVAADGAVQESAVVDVIEPGTINATASVHAIYYLK